MPWARTALSTDFTVAGGSSPSSLAWLLARGFSSAPHGPLHGAASSRESKWREPQDGSQSPFYNFILEVMYHHPFYCILLVTQMDPGMV